MKEQGWHYKVYKPLGMLSQFHSNAPREQHKKRFLGELFDFPEGIMAIGRLDEKSEGLLLLTSNGELSYKINNSGIEKEYWAQLDGLITNDAVEKLRKGVTISLHGESYKTKPCRAHIMEPAPIVSAPSHTLRIGRHRPSSWVRITVTEGKFRQIRKMTASVGFPTLRLIRHRIGSISLDGLAPGGVEQIEIDKI
ncbi:pseudouridine synthase [Lutimonas sp.]|uniref:pseudouridine synthase n=1 Tax=Lutimonas sp. TaxID=1872403 RepID=UPI003D9BEA14